MLERQLPGVEYSFGRCFVVACCSICCVAAAGIDAAEPTPTRIKIENFDHDPGWQALNNREPVEGSKTVEQDFGYSATQHAGAAGGEIGGKISRASRPAFYGERLATPRTLDDKLSASGTFAITECHGSAAVAFGWFSVEGRGSAGRPMNALALEFSGEPNGPRLTIRLTAQSNRAIGQKVTPFINDRKKVKGPGNRAFDAVQADGTRYAWQLDYDPAANDGNGRMTFVVAGNGVKRQPWEGKPIQIDIPAEVRKAGATFDHFGLLNGLKPGRSMTVYFDDVSYDGKQFDFASDPHWDEVGNRTSFVEPEQHGAHNFGFSKTSFAGGETGELGGTLWRGGDYAFYADDVGTLSLDQRLEARGKVLLQAGPSDSTIYFGWFNSADEEIAPTQSGDFVGIKVGGPSKVGHYFLPAYATTKTTPIERVGKSQRPANVELAPSEGPLLAPGKVYAWRLLYDPAAEKGRGALTATLGDQSVTIALKRDDRARGAKLDRFGLFTANHGGNFLKIYFDNLEYTTASPAK